MKCIDLTGRKFGRLTVIERVENYITPKGIQMPQWKCKCECGNEKVVRGHDLKRGNATSCGCLRKEKMAEIGKNKATHGYSRSRLYHIWADMKTRCYNPNSAKYHIYGAEGKTVCAEWLHDFQVFYDWAMSNGYRDDLTIERIDGTKGYSPDNCKWATKKEQNNNKRNNHLLEYNGKTQTITQWADELGIRRDVLYMRINKLHWNTERALTTK